MTETVTYPTVHSESRLELAQSMLPLLLKRDDIAAVVVGGSVGRGCADEYSDLEIGLVWASEPAPNDRGELLNTIGTHDGDDTVFIGGSSMIDAFKVDFIHITLDEIHQAFEDRERFGELRDFLWACVPIHNPAVVTNWQRTLHQQFRAGWFDQMQHHLRWLAGSWRGVASTPTDEYIMCRDKQIRIITVLIYTICIVHHELANGKWIQWSISQVKPCFTDLPGRLWSVFDRKPAAGFDVLRGLCLEGLDIIKGIQSDIGLDAVRKAIEDTVLGASVVNPPGIERCSARAAAVLLPEQLDAPWFAWNRAIFHAVRQEPCIFWVEMRDYADFVLCTLCLTNGIKPPPESDQCLIRLLPHLDIAPTNLGHRLERAFFTPPSEGLGIMHRLIEDTFDVVETHMPSVDCTESRYRFRHDRRKPWQEPPPLHT